MSDFSAGFAFGLSGISRLFDKGVRAFVLLPLLINALLFSAAIAWFGGRLSSLVERIEQAMPSFLDWAAWLLWPLFVIAALLVIFFGFTMIANLIGAPFNGLLAERVEDEERPDHRRPPSRPLLTEIPASVLNELRKLLYFLILAIPLLLLWLVPPVYPLLPFLWLAYGAWILAAEYLDYPMGNWQLDMTAQRKLMRKNRMLVLGFGTGVTVLTLIPVVNFIAMPAAVIGATRLWAQRLNAPL